MAILVTGGAGFIGSHTCVELLNAGYDVVIADNLYNASEKAVDRVKQITGKDLKFYKADIRDKEAMNEIFEKEEIESVIHFAGLKAVGESVVKPLEYYENNIAGTCLCVTALIPLFIGAIINADSDLFLTIMLSLSFLIAGVGVICFIKTGIIWASYEKLLQEGEYSKENKEKPSFSGAIYTAYWVIATAVYLGYSLSSNNWGQSWIIWVVAGVIFPAVIAITNAFEKKSK